MPEQNKTTLLQDLEDLVSEFSRGKLTESQVIKILESIVKHEKNNKKLDWELECPEGHASRHTQWIPEDYRKRYIEKNYIDKNEYVQLCDGCDNSFHYTISNNSLVFQHYSYDHN